MFHRVGRFSFSIRSGGVPAPAMRRENHLRIRWSLIALVLLGIAGARTGRADLEIEQTGQVASLPQPPSPHWAWVGDPVQRRSVLVDLENGRMLGNLAGGEGLAIALFPRSRRELYMPRTHYSRGDHGERVDALIFFDSTLLTPVGEVILPPKRAILAFTSGGSALSDDDRFAAVFNLTPATSISIVDLEARTFVEEVSTPGCSLVYPAGDRRFAMLCGNGALLLVTLDEAGRVVERTRSAPFFDPVKDPVTEKAARWGETWLFASFEGYLYSVDLSGAEPRFSEPWSLLSEADREASWRIGGTRHLAVHQATGRLYSLVHQGGPDTHKDAGSELWVYDLATRTRLQRIELENPGLTFMGLPIEFGKDWIWPFNRLAGWLLASVPIPIDEVQVTQDAAPLLVTAGTASGGLGIYDALNGEFLRHIYTGNMANLGLQLPSGWAGAAQGGTR